ncbi:hypothetical protein [Neobacillus vireti]|uniref:hypothetical protein n=1 Tax=Neobacillus vireti TaxID=220686 RepID=UPI002FFF4FEE
MHNQQTPLIIFQKVVSYIHREMGETGLLYIHMKMRQEGVEGIEEKVFAGDYGVNGYLFTSCLRL